MRRETIEEVRSRKLFFYEDDGYLGYTEFTELEQSLIKNGWEYLVLRENEKISMWWPERRSLYGFQEIYEKWRGITFMSYKYVRQQMFYHEYNPLTRTRTTTTSWKGFIIAASEYYRIPAEDGGPVD